MPIKKQYRSKNKKSNSFQTLNYKDFNHSKFKIVKTNKANPLKTRNFYTINFIN